MPYSKPPSRSSTRGPEPPKRRRFGAVLLALLVGGPLAASVTASVLPNLGRAELPKDQVATVPFRAGETLVYTVSWLKIEGGEMTLATSREWSPDGVPVHRIRLSAVSNDYVSRFYPVDTRYESWVDARDFTPVRFEKRAREGRYSADEVEEFVGALAGFAAVPAAQVERKGDVFLAGEGRKQIEELEDEADFVAADAGEFVVGESGEGNAVQGDFAGGGLVEGANEIEESGLARAGRADEGDHFASGDVQVHAVEREDFALAVVFLGELGNVDHGGISALLTRMPERGRRTDLYAGRAGAYILEVSRASGSNSVVECQLPKLDVAGSSPVSRSITLSSCVA